jgi:hypothetical protein
MEIQIDNWQKTLQYGNQYNNYQDTEIEETIIHTQYIGQCDEYVLVQSTIVGPGRDYENFQIWTYEDLDEVNDGRYHKVYLNKLVKEWER